MEYMQKGITALLWGEANNTLKWIHKGNQSSCSSPVKIIRAAYSIPHVYNYEALAAVAETWVGSSCPKIWGIYSCFL